VTIYRVTRGRKTTTWHLHRGKKSHGTTTAGCTTLERENRIMTQLTVRDWEEIYYALDMYVHDLKKGVYTNPPEQCGPEMDPLDAGQPAQVARHTAHLEAIMAKIGPDGRNAFMTFCDVNVREEA
jgi:hypothetical protein